MFDLFRKGERELDDVIDLIAADIELSAEIAALSVLEDFIDSGVDF